jgi:transcriptional regulator with XRE-family HTH domain
MATAFWERFSSLCEQKGVTPHKAMIETGLNTGNPPQWRQKGRVPSVKIAQTLARYFGVTTDYLLGAETEKAPASEETGASEEEVRFALFDGMEVSNETYEKVKAFARFAAAEERKGKERGIGNDG